MISVKCFIKLYFINFLDKFKLFNRDNFGNLSLEFILISIFMILILGSIIFPLVTHGINCTSDVYTAVSSKNEIVKLCSAIDYCYYSGKGSKKLVYLNFNKNTVIKLSNENNLGLATSKINLSQNSSKYFRIYLDCPFINEEIKFSKGFNKIVVEWPENSDYILLVH